MIRNYFLISIRNLKNSLVFSVLNVIGLSIGIGCCLVIGLFVVDQYSYDRQHENAERIYRVVNKQVEGTSTQYVAVTQALLGPELIKNFPEVKSAARVGFIRSTMNTENGEPSQQRIMAVDPSFFSIFTFPFLKTPVKPIGMKEIYISEEMSKAFFADKNPIGEIITLDKTNPFQVAGVFKDFPYQSHLQTNFIISFAVIEAVDQEQMDWSSNSYYNYILVGDDFDKVAFDKKLNAFVHRFTPIAWEKFEYFVQPLLDISLHAYYAANPSGSVGRITVHGFLVVAIIILAMACFNYMNLATARSAKRSLEVGVRKAMGAVRSQIVFQFFTESFLLCLLSFLLGILWADIGISAFNAFTGWHLDLAKFFSSLTFFLSTISSLILLTILAGSYPAFFLSRFMPHAVLKGQQSSDASRKLRKALVVVQFTLTSTLVILVTVVFKQMSFIRNHDLGFQKEELLLFSGDRNKDITVESMKAELLKIPGIKSVGSGSDYPGDRMNITDIAEANHSSEQSVKIQWMFADHDYIPTLGLQFAAGRNFYANGSDKDRSVIINEKAASEFGWTAKEAVGKKISGFSFRDSLPGEIIGVLKDFHMTPLRKQILPMVIAYSDNSGLYLARFESKNLNMTRKLLDEMTKNFMYKNSYSSVFFEDSLEETYGAERKTGEMLSVFTFLAILIGCSGLYALSAYEGEQRIKELGIRKIMGATPSQLLILLSGSFVKLIVISLILAMPIAWYLGNIWLRTFAYKISWSWDIFLLASLAVLILGWATIIWQAIKASRFNPVVALRYE